MLKIVLDSNVIISALVFGGKPRDILELVISGRLQLYLSNQILEETGGVLKGNKFQFPAHVVDAILKELEALAHLVEPQISIACIVDDPTDNKILECATASDSEYIVTGDEHLLKLKKYEHISIVDPSDFLIKVKNK